MVVSASTVIHEKNQDIRSPARETSKSHVRRWELVRSGRRHPATKHPTVQATSTTTQSSKQRLVLVVHRQASKAGLGTCRVSESSVARGSDSWLLSVGACVVVYIYTGGWLCVAKKGCSPLIRDRPTSAYPHSHTWLVHPIASLSDG